MGVPSIARMEERNLVGLCHLDVVNVRDVASMPDELVGNVAGDVILNEGASWSRIYLDDDGGDFNERFRVVNGAQHSDATITGAIAKHRLALMPHLYAMKGGRYLVRMQTRNGDALLMGRPEAGAKVQVPELTTGGVIGTDRSEYRITFSVSRRWPVPFHNGTVPEPEAPGACPTLEEQIADETWEDLAELLSEEQLDDAEASFYVPPADATAQLRDSAANNIGAPIAIASGGSANITAPDASYTLKDSASGTIGGGSIRSNANANIIAGDSTITKPDGTTAALLATAPLDVRNYRSGIIYSFGRVLWSGQSTSYATGDEGTMYGAGWFDYTRPVYPLRYAEIGSSWTTLASNNLWENTNRFTDRTGAQTYSDRIIQDHLTGLEYYVPTSLSAINWTNAISAAVALSYGGNSDWRIPPMNVLQTVVNHASGTLLNFAPFNITGVAVWTATTTPGSTSAALPMLATGAYQSTNKTSTSPVAIYCRRFI